MRPNPADTVVDLYQRHASLWAQSRRRDLFEAPWLDRFLSTLPDGPRAVLDLGCGTGQPMAGWLLAQGCQVTGVDAAPAMIRHARSSLPKARWITADMRALPPMGPFHGILAWHSLFHLTPDDQRALVATLGQLCMPGAALMFTSGPAQGEAMGRLGDQPLFHASLAPADYRAVLHQNGFDVIRHAKNDPACGGATIWLARKV